MMEFKNDIPIYRQIVDYAYSRILQGEWRAGERVPSVRELSAQMAVNTHTVLKAYEYLETHGIIEARRGMGFYATADAAERVEADRREHFFNETLADLFSRMDLLGIGIDEIVEQYRHREDSSSS